MTRPCYCCGARDPGDEEHCRYCDGYVGAVNKRLNDEAPLSGPRFCLRCHSAHVTHSVLCDKCKVEVRDRADEYRQRREQWE